MSDSELPRDPTPHAHGDPGDGISHGRLKRAVPLVDVAARTVGDAVVASVRSKLSGSSDAAELHLRAAERYAELLGRSKGALMKAGQMVSFASIGPAVPGELQSIYQSALMRLCSDAPPMSPEIARCVLERELACPVQDAFAEFDWQPLAAASIGQVHAGRLHDGRAVAVKLQYPGVASAVRADLKNTELLATFLSLTIGGLSSRRLRFDLRGAAREMGLRIAEELDYRLEAANQAEFAAHYRCHPFIHVPDVIGELCTSRVLTQELTCGLSWHDALEAPQGLRDQWVEAIWRFTYGTNKRINVLHADPHPGNYVFHTDGSVSFLDFGCVKRFSSEQVGMFDAIVRECLRNDALGIWRLCVEAGFWRSSDPVTPDEVLAYWRGDWEILWAQERVVITPEKAAKRVARRCSRDGPSANALRHLTMSPEYTVMGRIEVGVESVIAQLGGGAHWGAIAAEGLEDAGPLTEMGRREHEFFELSDARLS